MERLDWHDNAACAGMYVMFDLEIDNYETLGETKHWEKGAAMPKARRGKPGYMYRVEKACLDICASCPVRKECLDDALKYGDEYGVRGGMLPKERLALMDKMGIIPWSKRYTMLMGEM